MPPDDPLESEFEIVKKLKNLHARFQNGWAKQNPIAQRHMASVRQTIAEEWKKEKQQGQTASKKGQQQQGQTKGLKKAQKSQGQGKQKSQSQSPGKSQGHSH